MSSLLKKLKAEKPVVKLAAVNAKVPFDLYEEVKEALFQDGVYINSLIIASFETYLEDRKKVGSGAISKKRAS